MTSLPHTFRHSLPLVLALGLCAMLAGCGVGTVSTRVNGNLLVNGEVHGGMQPVSGATIQLYATGTGGNGSLAGSILTQPVLTNASGGFSITGDYTCSSANEQLYLVSKGGNPGLPNGQTNSALVLLSALGSCQQLIANPSAYIYVNEVSTVAAVYALAPFMKAYDHIGSSATNTVGIANAFLNAQLLANGASGQAATLPSNLAIETKKLYALADVIAACANSNGGISCTRLFSAVTAPGANTPTDTAGAVLAIVQHPASNVSNIFNQIAPNPPFPGELTAAPHDWTLSLTVTGGGLFEPTGLGIDGAGNVWAANFGGPALNGNGQNPLGVVAYSPQGTPFSPTPFSNGQMNEVYGLAVDRNGDVWITSEENIQHGNTSGSIAKVQGVNSGAPGTYVGMFYDNEMDFPESIASDSEAGTILVGNYASSTASIYSLSGAYVNNVGAYNASFPDDVTSDGNGGLWLANQGDYSITHVEANGTIQRPTCCIEANTVALDPAGDVWVTNFGAVSGQYTLSEVSPAGAVLIEDQPVTGLSTPGGATIDAAGTFWVLNYHTGSFLGVAGNGATQAPGTPLTPVALGQDANLVEPFAIAPDPSGDLWISNRGQNSLVMFFGLATPTATPASPRPSAP